MAPGRPGLPPDVRAGNPAREPIAHQGDKPQGVRRNWLVVLLTLVAAATLTAFLVADDVPSQSTVNLVVGAAPERVRGAEIRALATGSPERVVLRWFRAVQQQRVEDVLALIAPEEVARVGRDRISQAVRRAGPALGRPALFGMDVRSGSVVVRVAVLAYRAGSPLPVSAEPISLSLTKPDTAWRLANVSYLLATARG